MVAKKRVSVAGWLSGRAGRRQRRRQRRQEAAAVAQAAEAAALAAALRFHRPYLSARTSWMMRPFLSRMALVLYILRRRTCGVGEGKTERERER